MKNEIVFDKIKLLVLDVDGTMTDGGIYYDDRGNELKKFSVKDAIGLKAAFYAGIEVIVLTGRKSVALQRRMEELGVYKYYESIKNKHSFLKNYMQMNHIDKCEVVYIGDDLNDLNAMKLVSFVACPKDAVEEVVREADYISNCEGGKGVIRDVVKYILQQNGVWEKFILRIE